MKSLAILDPDVATGIVAQLKNVGIACETRSVTEESGVAATEVVVEDSRYDAACNIVEAWMDDEYRKVGMICPKCRSPRLKLVPHDSVQALFRCTDCGCEVLAQA